MSATWIDQLRAIPYPPTWAAPRTHAEQRTQESSVRMSRLWPLLLDAIQAAERALPNSPRSDTVYERQLRDALGRLRQANQ